MGYSYENDQAHQEWLKYAAQKQAAQQQAVDQAAQRQAGLVQQAQDHQAQLQQQQEERNDPRLKDPRLQAYSALAQQEFRDKYGNDNLKYFGNENLASQYFKNQALQRLGEEDRKLALEDRDRQHGLAMITARSPVEVQGLRNQGELAVEKNRSNTQKYGYDTNFDIHKYAADTNERIAGFRYPPGKTGGDTLSQADLAKAVIDWYGKNPVLPGQQQRPFKDVAREIREGLIPVEPPPLPGAEEKSAVQGLVAPSPTASLVGPQQQYNHGQNAIPTRTARWQDSVSPESAASLTDSQWQQYGRGQGATLNRMVPGIQNDQIAEFRRPDGTRLFANTAAVQDTLNRQTARPTVQQPSAYQGIPGLSDLIYRPTQEDVQRHAASGLDSIFNTPINQTPTAPNIQEPVQPQTQSLATRTSKTTTPVSTRKGVLPPQDPNIQLGEDIKQKVPENTPANANTQLGGGIKQRILANNPGMQPAFETVNNAANSYQNWIDDISARNRKRKPVDLSDLINSGTSFLTNKPVVQDSIDSYRWFHNRR